MCGCFVFWCTPQKFLDDCDLFAFLANRCGICDWLLIAHVK